MRKLAYCILTLASLLLAGCTLETSNNGDLDGFWQLTERWTYDEDMRPTDSKDMREELFFWSIQRNLLRIQKKDGAVLFKHKMVSDSLVLYYPCHDNRDMGDPRISDVAVLEPYDVTSIPDTFRVESLSPSKMALAKKGLRLFFRKY